MDMDTDDASDNPADDMSAEEKSLVLSVLGRVRDEQTELKKQLARIAGR